MGFGRAEFGLISLKSFDIETWPKALVSNRFKKTSRQETTAKQDGIPHALNELLHRLLSGRIDSERFLIHTSPFEFWEGKGSFEGVELD